MHHCSRARSSAFRSQPEVLGYLGVNVRTAQKWKRDRGLPVRRRAGKRVRVSVEAVSLESWKQLTYVGSQVDQTYRWPLGPRTTVEVRFCGRGLDAAHIDLLREYLAMFKTSLS